MNVPKYVWISAIVLSSIYEIRQWIDLYFTFSESDEDKNDDIPENVKHLYI